MLEQLSQYIEEAHLYGDELDGQILSEIVDMRNCTIKSTVIGKDCMHIYFIKNNKYYKLTLEEYEV